MAAALSESCHIESQVGGGVRLQAVVCKREEAAAWAQSALVSGVLGKKGVFLEMNKGTCDLNERLVERSVWTDTA